MFATKQSSWWLLVCLTLLRLCQRPGLVSGPSCGSFLGLPPDFYVTARAGCPHYLASDFPKKSYQQSICALKNLGFSLNKRAFFASKSAYEDLEEAWIMMHLVCCIASLFVSRCRDKFSRTRVGIGAFLAMPSPGSSPWQSSHHSAMPCHVSRSLVEGTCARQHPHLEPLDKSTKKKKSKGALLL